MVSLTHLKAFYAAVCLQIIAQASKIGNPGMSWSPFNTFRMDMIAGTMNQSTYEQASEALIKSGMRDAGYDTVATVCTGFTGRDATTGKLLENNTLWPGGMRSFADYVHSRGMKLSVYTGAAIHGCCGHAGAIGSEHYEDIDMETFAAWGADSVAVDFCNAGDPPGSAKYHVRDEFQKYADAIAKSSNPDMKLSVFNFGLGRPWTWAPQMGSVLFRVTSDIANGWHTTVQRVGIMEVVDLIQSIPDLNKYTGNATGSYALYGQLAVGVPPGAPGPQEPGLTLTEAQSQFSMWCMFSSPLIAGNDIRERKKDIEAILLNPEAIAVNQDQIGEAAWRIDVGHQPWRGDLHPKSLSQMQWARRLKNGDVAVLVLNRDDSKTQQVTVYFADFLDGMPGGKYHVRDMQGRTDVGEYCEKTPSFLLAPHQTAFLRLKLVDTVCTPASRIEV